MTHTELAQAISLAICLVEFEIENPQVEPIPPGWKHDLRKAQKRLTELHRRFEQIRERQRSIPKPPKPRRKVTPAVVEKLLRAEPDLSINQAARRLGCSWLTVKNIRDLMVDKGVLQPF